MLVVKIIICKACNCNLILQITEEYTALIYLSNLNLKSSILHNDITEDDPNYTNWLSQLSSVDEYLQTELHSKASAPVADRPCVGGWGLDWAWLGATLTIIVGVVWSGYNQQISAN